MARVRFARCGLYPVYTVRVDGAGARKILEAHQKSGLKLIILVQSVLAPTIWHVLVVDGKGEFAQARWLQHDRQLLDSLMPMLALHVEQFHGHEFIAARHVEQFLEGNAMDGDWIVGVDAEGLEILKQAGCRVEILPPGDASP